MGNGMIVSMPRTEPLHGYDHDQTLVLVANSTSTVTATAQVAWGGEDEPTGNFDIVKGLFGHPVGVGRAG